MQVTFPFIAREEWEAHSPWQQARSPFSASAALSPTPASQLSKAEPSGELADRFIDVYHSTPQPAGGPTDDQLRAAMQMVQGPNGPQMRLVQDLARMDTEVRQCRANVDEERKAVAGLTNPAAQTLGIALLDAQENDSVVMDNNISSTRHVVSMLKGLMSFIAPSLTRAAATTARLTGEQQPLLREEPARQAMSSVSSDSAAAPEEAVATTGCFPLSLAQYGDLRAIGSSMQGLVKNAEDTHVRLIDNALKATAAVRKAAKQDGQTFVQNAELQSAMAAMEQETSRLRQQIKSGQKRPDLQAQIDSYQRVARAANHIKPHSVTATIATIEAKRFTGLQKAGAFIGTLAVAGAIAGTVVLCVYKPEIGMPVMTTLVSALLNFL